ncbi:hypothetical protein SDC9_114058 [bioreactor metagenome]|uniref:Uncharacterized protein n=1 Tax=bioreactor metagenome TaxID=1076179 RepID=A0A645BRA5_9ZZZZ
MHIQHQHRGGVVFDEPRQQNAGEEGFASAGGAKNAGAALNKLIEVNTNRVILFAGLANDEVAILFW